ncbi:MAG: FAD-binding oxidoreductase [Clostridia bacterium]|jgi:FAD/FMN-containing dehydrogenase|nr:FAD-binding oxidoreductase [Clostridia bacterium]MDH7572102.1 FAD-binding oxidoreductase [Clostridia bacterium]
MPNWVEKLKARVGSERVLTSPSVLACYARDFSLTAAERLPEAVVLVRAEEEAAAVLALAQEERVPVVPRGAGTGVAGGAVPVRGGIVLDLSLMNRLIRIEPGESLVILQPGVVWADLNRVLAGYGLFAPTVPGSGRVSTVGGAVAAGGSGMRSLKYGTVREQVRRLSVVLPNGGAVELGALTFKSACGYDLKDLFVGSEGTLGVITGVALRVWPRPPAALLIEAETDRPEEIPAVLGRLRGAGVVPSAFEFIPRTTLAVLEEGTGVSGGRLMIEFQGPRAEVEGARSEVLSVLESGRVRVWETPPEQAGRWDWYGRVYFHLIRLRPAVWAEDLGVPAKALPAFLDEVAGLSREAGLPVGVIAHAGEGTVHCVVPADRKRPAEWEKANRLREELYRRVLELGGTVTAEHGVGVTRTPFARRELGPALGVMRQIKKALDPNWIMNPGKLGLED